MNEFELSNTVVPQKDLYDFQLLQHFLVKKGLDSGRKSLSYLRYMKLLERWLFQIPNFQVQPINFLIFQVEIINFPFSNNIKWFFYFTRQIPLSPIPKSLFAQILFSNFSSVSSQFFLRVLNQAPVTGPKYVLAQALISQIPNFSSLKKWLFKFKLKFSRLQTLYSDLQVVFGELKGVFGEIVYEIADNLDLKHENYLWGFKVGTNIIFYNGKQQISQVLALHIWLLSLRTLHQKYQSTYSTITTKIPNFKELCG